MLFLAGKAVLALTCYWGLGFLTLTIYKMTIGHWQRQLRHSPMVCNFNESKLVLFFPLFWLFSLYKGVEYVFSKGASRWSEQLAAMVVKLIQRGLQRVRPERDVVIADPLKRRRTKSRATAV